MFTITDVALQYLEQHLDDNSVLLLSISVECSGVSYQFGISDSIPNGWSKEELVGSSKNLVLAVPECYRNVLYGTQIDFSENLDDPGFSFSSPNLRTGPCGSCDPDRTPCC